MRVLFFSTARLLESRGTPSRGRNLARALARQPDTELLVLSGDPAGSLAAVVGAEHASLGATGLEPAVVSFRPDVVYGQTHKAAALLAPLARRLAARIVDLHGDLAAERLEQSWRPWPRRLAGYAGQRWRDARWLPRMDGFTTVTEALAARVRPLGRPVEVLWGGVDPELFTAPPPPDGERLTVGYAGNFRPYQGLGVLIEAVARAGSDFELLMVGGPGGGESVADSARTALGARLRLQEPVPYDEIPRVLAAADILVVPRPVSRSARFGFPSKLPEYLALGRPVVVTDVGEQARVVEHGVTGWVVAAGSVAALAEALERLRDPGLRRRMAAAARRAAEERLTWDQRGRQLRAFLAARAGGGG